MSDEKGLKERLRALLAKASTPNSFDWYFPWRVKPSDGKPIIVGAKSGNLFRGFIATWDDAELAVAAVNALPTLLDTIARLEAEVRTAAAHAEAESARADAAQTLIVEMVGGLEEAREQLWHLAVDGDSNYLVRMLAALIQKAKEMRDGQG